jgi:hypothetical protein
MLSTEWDTWGSDVLHDEFMETNENTEVLLGASKMLGKELIADKANICCSAVANRNLIQAEIKRRVNSGNACHHSVQNLLSSRQLSKILKIRIYKTIILRVVLYGCETWSLTLREEHTLRVSERVLRRIFGPKRDEVTGEWRKLHNEELRDLYVSPSIIRIIKSWRMRRVNGMAF